MEELKEMIRLAKLGDKEAKDYIVRKHINLVKKVVRSTIGKQDEDMVAIGFRGILKAIDKFDLDKNVRFSTIATYEIRGVISNELTNRSRDNRKINYMDGIFSLNAVMEESNSEGNEDELYTIIEVDNGEYHGYQHILEDEKSSVFKAVEKLSKDHQILFELKYLEGLSDVAIAERLGIGRGKVNWAVRKMRRELNDIMGLNYDIPGTVSSKNQKRNRSHLIKNIEICS